MMLNTFVQVAGGVLGAVYVLLVPGLVLSFAFFPRGRIDIIERVALSFALSIAVVPLTAFYLNLGGVRITRLNVILEVGAITAVAGLVAWQMARRSARKKEPERADKAEPKPVGRRPAPAVRPQPSRPPTPKKRRIQF
jgi:uncharacterized membrane protein